MPNIPQETLIPIYQGKITNDGTDQHLVDGRTLHAYLKVGQHFTDWMKNRIKKYGFLLNIDYTVLDHKTMIRTNIAQKNYSLTLNMAKELAMVERSQKGREARRYFIECERQLIEASPLQNPFQSPLQQGKQEITTLDDLYNIGYPLEDIDVRVTRTRGGEIVKIRPLEQSSGFIVDKKAPTIPKKTSWIAMVETFFAEIDNGGIPEKMRQNILLSKETTSTNEQHDCLFFRLSNLMAFFRKTPRFADLMNESTIQTASMLLKQLKGA
ncbi:MAG: hypothetical protein HAW67_05755, partial [Endozoicomonadaceae bacterium]|nr:hypothetical protein [Endozoicomonadaceae bacterium]